MKTNLMMFMATLVWGAAAHAQITNFTPITLSIEHDPGADGTNHGILVTFTTDVGRFYRLETSTNLVNWSTYTEVIASDTNVGVYVSITNPPASDCGTNIVIGPPPEMSSTLAVQTSQTSVSSYPPLPPSPWDWLDNDQQSRDEARMSTMDEENGGGCPPPPPALSQFFRVVCPEDRIQFPDFEDVVEQKASFTVWTSIVGTYRLELWWDNDLAYDSGVQTIPASGIFGVSDGAYNPSNWPYDGFYEGDEFNLDVTIMPSGSLANAPITATAKKKIRLRSPNRFGITASQGGVLPNNLDDDLNFYMEFYMAANWAGAQQIDFDGGLLDISSSPLVIGSTNDWARLQERMINTSFFDPHITDLHYFGHGWPQGIGFAKVLGQNISLAKVNVPNYLVLWPMSYVFLDGCNTAQEPEFIKELIGIKKQMNRQALIQKGLTPAFGIGWKSFISTAYLLQGQLNAKHFDWVADYYTRLAERDFDGYLTRTFADAMDFANNPQGNGINPNWNTNSEGQDIKYYGCSDCLFNEFRQ